MIATRNESKTGSADGMRHCGFAAMLRRSVLRRHWFGLLVAIPLVLAGCVGVGPQIAPPDAGVRQALAPTGVLRVGVYAGSPLSWVKMPAGDTAGISHDLGQALGKALGVPVQVVEFPRIALVIEGLQKGQADITFTNASPARQRVVDFTSTLLSVELGYLVPPQTRLRSIDAVDAPGVRVGVTEGSSSLAALTAQYKSAKLVSVANLGLVRGLLQDGQLDAFATNKAILSELQDGLPGFQILPGRWGLEHLAVAVPKGREAGMPWLRDATARLAADGRLAAMAQRAGLRGLAKE